MRRRQALAIIGAGAVVMTFVPRALAQRMARVGFLAPAQPTPEMLIALRKGLGRYGYVEGQNLSLHARWPQGNYRQLPRLADELVDAKVDVILAWASPAIEAAQRATPTLPIVMVAAGNPIATGYIASLARPGGNITGVTNMSSDLSGKQTQLMMELVPGITRIVAMRNPDNPISTMLLRETEVAGRLLGLQIQVVEARNAEEIKTALARVNEDAVKGMVVLSDPLFIAERDQIADLAKSAGVATSFSRRENVVAGGLLSYGPSLLDQFQKAADYLDKILKGAKPGDLPVEQPTKFELVTNLKTAKSLGLTIPSSILLRANEVIE